ncbi:MAG: hypothetical protein Q4C82_04650 [Eubacteriales bacterium]|nr:hypothetical protein [Eubacteriales bacterium]
MKNRSYYFLFLLYILMFAFILYINGVFTGGVTSVINLAINISFLVLIGVLLVASAVTFGRLNQAADALDRAAEEMKNQHDAVSKNLWEQYRDRKSLFGNRTLDLQFEKYQRRIREHTSRKGTVLAACPVEDYINEDVIDRIGSAHYNSAVAGTMSGLGILGTFLGLTLGMLSFSGSENNVFTISDNIGPLLEGMKVAFHTSVYGIFFSLVFNFVYRGVMADAYGRLTVFLEAFHEYAEPPVSGTDENMSAMLIYQANMANAMRSIMELLQGREELQIKGLDRIVQQFINQMSETMGTELGRLGRSLNDACEAQSAYARNFQRLEESTKLLLDASRAMNDTMHLTLDRQRELEQKLSDTCDQLGNELYTFHQMRDLYEK